MPLLTTTILCTSFIHLVTWGFQERGVYDWSEVRSYSSRNAQLAPPAKGEKRVVFMGDSITQGWKLETSFPGKPYVNRGISGQTTFTMLIRFQADVVALKPKAVLILAGTNDLSGNDGRTTVTMIEQNLASMAEIAKTNKIKVILASVLPRGNFVSEVAELNEWIKNYANKKGFTYLDYFSHTVDSRRGFDIQYSGDGLHPNQAGYDVMAPLAAAAIESVLSKR